MTHAISPIRAHVGESAQDTPYLPGWVAPRDRLSDRLDQGVTGRVTLVTGPPGWGKTLGVTSWAARTQHPGRRLWLSASGTTDDPDLFLELLRDRVEEAGVTCPTLPGGGPHEAGRMRALALLGRALRRSGSWVLVLDDFPTGDAGVLSADLEVVLHHAQRSLSLVVISHGQPALAVQRHHVAGDLARITVADLAMDRHEVADVLTRHGVDAGELTARTVARHTSGWPCGVRLAAHALRESSTLEAALASADRASVDFLASEVLGRAPVRTRELLVRTSMVAEVDEGLARAVLGPDAEAALTPAIASEVFVELHGDRSFSCPPLLRAAARAVLAREPREVSRDATRRAAQWHVDRDETSAGLEIAMTAGDWPWVAGTLVESLAVAELLAGEVSGAVESALAMAPVRAAEPLLDAALLLRRGGQDATEAAGVVLDDPHRPHAATPASELSELLLRLALARAVGDVETGLPLAVRARELVSRLPVDRRRVPATVMAAQEGALAVTAGALDRAQATLRRGAEAPLSEGLASSATLDCLGQLALLEAYQDNLRTAERQAAAVLNSAGHDDRPGVAHAHLAAARVHVERAEPVPARQHLDRAAHAARDVVEPWFRTALLLTEVRLLAATGQPEAAHRMLAPALQAATQQDPRGWRTALLTVASAEALVAASEPRRALDLVAPGLADSAETTAVVSARALLDLGDLRGARTVLGAVVPGLASAPLGVQVEAWVLEARLTEGAERARLLVDRALRIASREQLRRPFVHESAWLLPLVDRDPTLRRAHGGFLARLSVATPGSSVRGARSSLSGAPVPGPSSSGQLLVETLTVREAQVLGLLAEMCSTEEIARELFLSVNTVKTYVRGILRKLSVNRRVDAVRRGRELGLC